VPLEQRKQDRDEIARVLSLSGLNDLSKGGLVMLTNGFFMFWFVVGAVAIVLSLFRRMMVK